MYLFAAANIAIREDLAGKKLYAPQDSLADVAAAPFNIEVLKRLEIWAVLIGGVAAYIGVSFLIEDELTSRECRQRRQRVREDVPVCDGRPARTRGVRGPRSPGRHRGGGPVSRRRPVWNLAKVGKTGGLLLGTLIFGAMHVGPAFTLEGEDRRNFLRYRLPAVVAAGAYFGWLYQRSDYSLAPPTAMHFWFDFLLSGAFYVIRPNESPISFTYEARF